MQEKLTLSDKTFFSMIYAIYKWLFSQSFDIHIYIPAWTQPRNIAGIIRTATIMGYHVHIGPSSKYARLITKHRDTIEHCVMGANNYHVVVDMLSYLQTRKHIIIMESQEFWDSRNEVAYSIYDVPKYSEYTLVFGDEGLGIPSEFWKNIGTYIACYIPQSSSAKNTRNNTERNHVSFNLNSAATLSMGILTALHR